MATTSLTLDEIYNLAYKVLRDNGCDEFNETNIPKYADREYNKGIYFSKLLLILSILLLLKEIENSLINNVVIEAVNKKQTIPICWDKPK